MSAIDAYFDDVSARLNVMRQGQRGAIEAAAERGAEAMKARRPLYLFDTGHLITHEFSARTGGLAAYTALVLPTGPGADNEFVLRTRQPSLEQAQAQVEDTVRQFFSAGLVEPGDLIFISSVSGTKPLVVELARQARSLGVGVVALTGVDFSRSLVAAHPNGNRLCDEADVVLDCAIAHGDASIEIPGASAAVAPWSGIAGGILMWAVTTAIVERLVVDEADPTIYTSVNLPGGWDAYLASRTKYREEGW